MTARARFARGRAGSAAGGRDPWWAGARRRRRGLLLAAAALLGLVLAVAAASAVATSRFRARYEAEKAELVRRGLGAAGDPRQRPLEGLPPPVRGYVERMRAAGARPARIATLRQRGSLRTAADAPWMPFVAEQVYSMHPPAFVWYARAELAPLVHLLARDRFVDGRGHMLVQLLGLVPLADELGPEIDQGAGLRYWGEIIAFPERALDPRVSWEPLDDRRARMVVEQEGASLVAEVEFGEDGLPAAVVADRYRDVGGEGILTRWSGHLREWEVIDGRPFPSRWESVWHLAEGDFAAVRMEIVAIETE